MADLQQKPHQMPLLPALPSGLEHPPPLVNLLKPIFDHDPQLNRRIQNHLWEDCAGLEHVDRAILGAVLQHMPSPPAPAPPISMPDITRINDEQPQPESLSTAPTIIDRILSLPVDQLKLLSNLFSVALTDAHSWGGLKPKSGFGSVSASPGIAGSPTTAKEDPLVIYHTLFTSLGVPMLPTLNNPTATTLDRPDHAPTPGARKRRSALQTESSHARHLNACPITLKESALEHAHILPYSVIKLESDRASPFWMMLGVCLGPSLRDNVFSILNGSMRTTINSLSLDSGLHTAYDSGLFHLAPTGEDLTNFDPATCRYYDLCFRWWGTQRELSLWATRVYQSPDAQVRPSTNSAANTIHGATTLVHAHGGPVREIADRDLYRIFTNNPAVNPLPHPLLLEIHGMLWRMMATVGMSSTRRATKRRYSELVSVDDGQDLPRSRQRGSAGSRKHGGHSRGETESARGGDREPENAGEPHEGGEDTEHGQHTSNVAYLSSSASSPPSYTASPKSEISGVLDDTRHFGPCTSPPPSVPEVNGEAPEGPKPGHLEYVDFQLARFASWQTACSAASPDN